MLSRTFSYFRRKGRCLPKSLTSLTAPKLKRSWQNLHALSAAEKKEIIHGSWRQNMPVQLVSDADDRDRGGFAEPLSFSSDEAAADFLDQETEDERLEQRIPTLELAQQFFENLAATASEEACIEDNDGVLLGSEADMEVPGSKSDEARRNEQLDAHRRFFADYYIQQGIVFETERHAFVNAMLCPAITLFQVNGELPLTRLVVRDQLESHAERSVEKVFRSTPDPLTYSVMLTPTQPNLGKPSAGSVVMSSIPIREAALPPPPPPKQESMSPSADVATFLDSLFDSEGDPDSAESTDDAARPLKEDFSFVYAPEGRGDFAGKAEGEVWRCAMVPSFFPQPTAVPSVAHLHWLQRQIATGVLTAVDAFTPIVSRLAVGLASDGRGRARARGSPEIIFDMFGARAAPFHGDGTRSVVRSSYYRDVANYARVTRAQIQQQLHSPPPDAGADAERQEMIRRGEALDSVVVIAAFSPSRRPERGNEGVPGGDDLVVRSSHRVSVSEQAPSLAFLRPPGDSRGGSACGPLRRACRVVLFAPPTTEDGVRPRGELGEGLAAANAFIGLCGRVNGNFARLRRELRTALGYARAGGWLLYATHSLNPLENEAVVCALLTALRREGGGEELQGLRVACVPLDAAEVVEALAADERETFTRWVHLGERGVASWVALEGAPDEQEVAWCDPAVVAEVSAAAWRLNPLHSGFDGGFVILLKVCEGVTPLPLPESLPSSIGSDPVKNEEASVCSGTHLLLGGDGQELKLWRHAASREFSVVTASLAEWCTSFVKDRQCERSPRTVSSSEAWTLAIAGLTIGCDASIPEVGKKGGDAALLSAAVWDEQVAAWLARSHACGRYVAAPHVYPISITLPMLCELLRLGKLTSRELEYWVSQRRRQQPSDDPKTEADQTAKEEEIHAFFHSVKGLLDDIPDDHYTADSSLRLQGNARDINVLLSPSLPLRSSAGATEVEFVLHEAVMQELAAVKVVATLTFSKSVFPKNRPGGERSMLSFSLELRVPDGIQDRNLHLEAIHEMSVGLRDAFLYTLRRIQYPHTIVLTSDRAYETGTASRTPKPSDVVKLQEDEYEVLRAEGPDPISSILPVREVRRRERRLHGLRRRLNEHGINTDGTPPNDWMWTLPYARRGRQSRQSSTRCATL